MMEKNIGTDKAQYYFPIVGKLKENKAIIEDKVYEMGQHGFARDMKFNTIKDEVNSKEYMLETNERNIAKVPILL